jgi:hypothetical protein
MPELTGIIEGAVKTALSKQIPVLINLFGVVSKIHRKQDDVYADVYGQHSGITKDPAPTETKILLVASAWNVQDLSHSGMIDDPAHAYHTESAQVGDTFEVVRTDGRTLTYQIVHSEMFGSTTDVIYRSKVSAVAG